MMRRKKRKELKKILLRIKYNLDMCNFEEWFQCFKEDVEKETGLDFWEAQKNYTLQKPRLGKLVEKSPDFQLLLCPSSRRRVLNFNGGP